MKDRQSLKGVCINNIDSCNSNSIPDLSNITEEQQRGIFAQITQEQFEQIGSILLDQERIECQKYYAYARTSRFLSMSMRTALGENDRATTDDVKNLIVSLGLFHDPLAAFRDRALYVLAATYNSSRNVLSTTVQTILNTLGSNGSKFNTDANHLYFFYGVGVPKWFDDMVGILCGELDERDGSRTYFSTGEKVFPSQVNGENKLFKTFYIRRMIDQTVDGNLKYMVPLDHIHLSNADKTTFFNTELTPVKIRTYGVDTAYHFSQFNRCFGLHKYKPVNAKEVTANGKRLKGGGNSKGVMGEVRPSLFTDIQLLTDMAMMDYYGNKVDYYEKFIARIHDVMTNEMDIVCKAVDKLVSKVLDHLKNKVWVGDKDGVVLTSNTHTTGAVSVTGVSASAMKRTQQATVNVPPNAETVTSQQVEFQLRNDPLPGFFIHHITELMIPVRIRHAVMNLNGSINDITSTLIQRNLNAHGLSSDGITRQTGSARNPIRMNNTSSSSSVDNDVSMWTKYMQMPFGAILNFDEQFLKELRSLKRSEAISNGVWGNGLKKGNIGSSNGPRCASEVYPFDRIDN